MALEFRMVAHEVTSHGGGRWEECSADDDGAELVDRDEQKPSGLFSMYGIVDWLKDAAYVRMVPGKSRENFTLGCVRAVTGDDPNAKFFVASPSGQFTGAIDNQAAHDYIKPGESYRVIVEKIRGPRKKGDPEEAD